MKNKTEKKISVIMGVHNGGSRFLNAVKSIEEQTYGNWEFIICDDGSTDDTYIKLMDYARDKANYKIIKNENNLGLAATLNHCIEHCEGEFIARMDDDDISYPTRFECQVSYLENNPEIAFVSSNVDIFDGEKIIGERKLKQFPTKKDMVKGSQFVHPATMFRMEALRTVGGYRVSKDTVRGQDYDLFMRLYGKGYCGANIIKPLFRYTEDNANLKRRTLKARTGEIKIRIYGYKAMKVMYWAFPYLMKPYLAWLFTVLRGKVRGERR